MADIEQRARELLAAELKSSGIRMMAGSELYAASLRAVQAALASQAQVPLPAIVKEVLEWYARDPRVWVAWNEEGWAEEDAAKKSGHYTYIGEDKRGHNEYVPNGVRAEEALAALVEWGNSGVIAAAPAPEVR